MAQPASPPAAPKPRPAWRIWLKLGLAALLLGAAGLLIQRQLAQPTIGEILAAPTTYEGREVKVRGTVTRVMDLPGEPGDFYLVMDPDGQEIAVRGGELPKKGAVVTVRGAVRVPVEGRVTRLVHLEVTPSTP